MASRFPKELSRRLRYDPRLRAEVKLYGARKGRGGIVVYDNVPVGAGHVHELFKFGRDRLEAALAAMHGGPEHHGRCEAACLDCLLTFGAQEAMHRGLFRRRVAHDALAGLLGRIVAVSDAAATTG